MQAGVADEYSYKEDTAGGSNDAGKEPELGRGNVRALCTVLHHVAYS